MMSLLCVSLLGLALTANAKWIDPPMKEGKQCDRVNGELWKCTRTSECSWSYKLIHSKHLAVCSKDKNEYIICCPKSARVPSTPKPSTSTPKPSISNQKCQEYERKSRRVNIHPSVVVLSSLNEEDEEMMEEKPEEGWVNPDVGIIDGAQVKPGQFPHSALIGYGTEKDIVWQCGGTLISEKYVLSAAHCVNSTEKGIAKWVLLGDCDYSSTFDDEGAQQFQIVDRVKHDSYDPSTLYHDVALFRLDRDVVFTQYVAPACLYPGRTNPQGTVIALGWGFTGTSTKPSEKMLMVSLDYMSAEECTKFMGLKDKKKQLSMDIVDSEMICAYNISTALCKGDSGSGIVLSYRGNQRLHQLAGITSFVKYGCFQDYSPSVFMRVAYYIPWIEKIVWPSENDIIL